MTILVIEDDPDIREIVSEVLTRSGYTVINSANGLEALNLLLTQKPHVILLDMRMPVMDGWEFSRQFRLKYDHSAQIIVMTAAHDVFQRAADIKADGILSKPFDMMQLLTAVKQAVSQWSRRRDSNSG